MERRTPSRALAPNGVSSFFMGLGGLEPPTSRLSGVRSNHLSYRPGIPNATVTKDTRYPRGFKVSAEAPVVPASPPCLLILADLHREPPPSQEGTGPRQVPQGSSLRSLIATASPSSTTH